ncbi:ABC transporter substrate-binding protein [Desulfoluna spongiiphila]|uniref:Putative ABC transport system substrate-binding protein n=1 Tax=Desulfoluna spongiiphila TaxID=419481 RepID=A0A1G5CY71_9BACT|nr:ABC transporter substrate-binding protein [Desulfoluna spongiiphila]SCY07227.1 putative ABC transport system substrate-binding protein [Desulfoluna spongiiphila]
MKRLTIFILALAGLLMLTTAPALAKKPVIVGISKIVAHPALDALEKGVMDGITEDYPRAIFDLQNANGEISTAASIAQKFKAEKVDISVGIATPTAQALVNTIKNRPVIYCAVTDPVDAGLIGSFDRGEKNIAGVSDMTPVKEQIKFLASVKNIKSLGHIYSSSEVNAVRLAELAEEACRELGIAFVPATVSNSAEVKQAIQTIIRRVDGIYISNDNTVVSALSAITDVAAKHNKPVMSADPSSAETIPVLAAWGFDYYKMGRRTGRLVAEILSGTKPETVPTIFMTDPSDIDLLLNLDVAESLGLSFPEEAVKNAATLVKNGKIIKQ